jgi:hypothetical protein
MTFSMFLNIYHNSILIFILNIYSYFSRFSHYVACIKFQTGQFGLVKVGLKLFKKIYFIQFLNQIRLLIYFFLTIFFFLFYKNNITFNELIIIKVTIYKLVIVLRGASDHPIMHDTQ